MKNQVTNLVGDRESEAVLHAIVHERVVINDERCHVLQKKRLDIARLAKPLPWIDCQTQIELSDFKYVDQQFS